jgi:hypothetical protein
VKNINSKTKRTRKYFAPQNEGVHRKCDHPDCNKSGEFKAPKDRTLKEYYWFCLEHVQEYNSKWSYFMGEEEIIEENTFQKRARFKGFHSKIKYKFGCDLNEELSFLHGFSDFDKVSEEMYFSRDDKKELEILELSTENFSKDKLKKQYKKLAKKYHPDLNPGDKDAEEKFIRITEAYKKLLEKLD